MYGLLLMNLQDYVVQKFGEKKWESIREALKITDVSMNFHSNIQACCFQSICAPKIELILILRIFFVHHPNIRKWKKMWRSITKFGL